MKTPYSIICFSMLYLSCMASTVFAQNTDMASVGSMTPDGATLARNINIPADLYTGRLNVQVPLYTINSRNFSIPITLEYQTSGIKVEDMTSWVGRGWTLQCGGMVARIVRGYPDETGYCDGDFQKIKDTFEKAPNSMKNEFMKKWYDQKIDGEADVFYFQIPGYGGLFVCDEQGVPHTIPYQNIDIEWVDKTYFRITDEKGNIYTLGPNDSARETTQYKTSSASSYGNLYTSTWYLTQIETSNHISIARFLYESPDAYTFQNSNKIYWFTMNRGNVPNFNRTETKDVLYKISPRHLTSITWDKGSINFEKSATRLNEIQCKLDNLNIVTPGISYKIHFAYLPDKLSLQSVDLEKGTKKMPICSFVYNNVAFPAHGSYSVDYWGYYNGAPDTSDSYPTFVYKTRIYEGENHRNPDPYFGQANILKKICYPRGGYHEFEYEGHTGYDRYGGNYKDIGGIRIIKVTEFAGDEAPISVTKYEYLTDANQSSGIYNECIKLCTGNVLFFETSPVWSADPMFFYSKNQYVQRDVSGTYVGYTQVKETASDGSYKVHKFNSFYAGFDFQGEKAICNSAFWGFETDDTGIVPATSCFWRRGMKSSECQYSASGELVGKTTYDYKYIAKNVITSFPIFNEMNTWHLGRYYWKQGTAELTSITQSGKYIPTTRTEITYNSREQVTRLQKSFPDNTTATTTYKYSTDYAFTGTDAERELNPISLMQLRHISVPIESLTLKNGKITSGTITKYRTTIDGDSLKIHYDQTLSLNLPAPITENALTASIAPTGVLKYDSRYECTEKALNYDTDDNITGMNKNTRGNYIYMQYNKNESQPVAVVEEPCPQDPFSIAIDFGDKNESVISTPAIDGGIILPRPTRTQNFYYNSFEQSPYNVSPYSERAKSGRYVCEQDLNIGIGSLKTGKYNLTYWYLESGVWKKHSEIIEVSGVSLAFKVPASAARPIDEVRIIPRDATMQSYCYLPGVGKISETDANGITTHYEYNDFGLLSAIYDDNGILLEKYDYDNFQNE